MTDETLAVRCLEILSGRGFLSCEHMRDYLPVDVSTAHLRKILDRLVTCGRCDRNGGDQIEWQWRLFNSDWDRDDPFALVPAQPETICRVVHEYPVEVAETISHLQAKIEELEKRETTGIREVSVKVANLPEVKMDANVHPSFTRVLKLTANRINVLLVGPAGSGKTHLGRQIADALCLDFAFISCSAGMSEGALLGRLLPTGKGGQFEYLRSEFVRCYEDGGVFLFDEVDAADANTLLVLNTALANGHLAIPNRASNPVAKKHKNFVCIAAANTYGTGSDRQYVGRNQLDEAFLDRFRVGQVCVDYDETLERILCPDDALRSWCQGVRKNVIANKIRRVISTRFMKDAHKAVCAGLSYAEVAEGLFGGWRLEEIVKATEGMNKHPTTMTKSTTPFKAQEEESESIPPMTQEEKDKAPVCPSGHGPMIRMHTGKGYRCAVPGNKYRNKQWSICNHCVWDKTR